MTQQSLMCRDFYPNLIINDINCRKCIYLYCTKREKIIAMSSAFYVVACAAVVSVATCALLSWPHSAFRSTFNSFIVSHIVRIGSWWELRVWRPAITMSRRRKLWVWGHYSRDHIQTDPHGVMLRDWNDKRAVWCSASCVRRAG